jgi:transposase
LSQLEAAELLGMSERTFRRWRDRLRDEGAEGLVDRRVGKASPRRAPASELARARALYEEMYGGFTVKHFHEKLVERHGYKLGYTVTRLALQRSGLVRPARRRGAHRRKRPRRPMAGMMLHQDGSSHVWLQGHAPLDLIVTMDDATSEIYSAFLVAEEGTASSFRGLAETIARKGLFCALYTDRGSHYFHTPEAGAKVSKTQLTQVGRALAELGIEHIPGYSPEARGRSERLAALANRLRGCQDEPFRRHGSFLLTGAGRQLISVRRSTHNRRGGPLCPPEPICRAWRRFWTLPTISASSSRPTRRIATATSYAARSSLTAGSRRWWSFARP